MRAAHGADDFDHFGHVVPSGFRLTPAVSGPSKRVFSPLRSASSLSSSRSSASITASPSWSSDYTGKNLTQLVTDPFSQRLHDHVRTPGPCHPRLPHNDV